MRDNRVENINVSVAEKEYESTEQTKGKKSNKINETINNKLWCVYGVRVCVRYACARPNIIHFFVFSIYLSLPMCMCSNENACVFCFSLQMKLSLRFYSCNDRLSSVEVTMFDLVFDGNSNDTAFGLPTVWDNGVFAFPLVCYELTN